MGFIGRTLHMHLRRKLSSTVRSVDAEIKAAGYDYGELGTKNRRHGLRSQLHFGQQRTNLSRGERQVLLVARLGATKNRSSGDIHQFSRLQVNSGVEPFLTRRNHE